MRLLHKLHSFPRSSREDPAPLAAKSGSDEPLVITFCDRDYMPVLANFVAAVRKLKPRPLRVYCLDEDTFGFCQAAGIEAHQLSWDGSMATLWMIRVQVFRSLLADGQDFIHSDADAIWLRDPIDRWTAGGADMTFSQGTIHPGEVHRELGFVLCCGFFRMNATDGAIRFVDRLQTHVAETGDDQTSVNQLLLAAGTQWDDVEDPDYRLRIRGQSFKCWKRPIEGHAAELNLSVSLIPHFAVQRIDDPLDTTDRAYVKHPLAAKEPATKLEEFERQGLLAVRSDWSALPASAVLADYLA